jgi:hypothetical protein
VDRYDYDWTVWSKRAKKSNSLIGFDLPDAPHRPDWLLYMNSRYLTGTMNQTIGQTVVYILDHLEDAEFLVQVRPVSPIRDTANMRRRNSSLTWA